MMNKFFLFLVLVLGSTWLNAQSLKTDFAKAMANNNNAKMLVLAEQLKKSYSSFTYAYYTVLLRQLPQNAILVTNGIDDTFPLEILQETSKIREDVTVVSLELLKDSAYLKQVNTRLGKALKLGTPSQLVKQLTTSNNVFISTTVSSGIWFNSSYYLTGLVVKKSGQGQYASLVNFYKAFKSLNIASLKLTKSDRKLIKNVLPALITLRKLGGDNKVLKKEISDLAALVGETDRVQKIIAAME